MNNIDKKNERLQDIQLQMYEYLKEIDSDRKSEIYPYIISIDGMIIFNKILFRQIFVDSIQTPEKNQG